MSIPSQPARALLGGLCLFSIQKAGTGLFLGCNIQVSEQIPLAKGQRQQLKGQHLRLLTQTRRNADFRFKDLVLLKTIPELLGSTKNCS